jgi:hypothetical protein
MHFAKLCLYPISIAEIKIYNTDGASAASNFNSGLGGGNFGGGEKSNGPPRASWDQPPRKDEPLVIFTILFMHNLLWCWRLGCSCMHVWQRCPSCMVL